VTGLATIRASLEQCYDAIEALAGRMDATTWHAQSLCPAWDMRAVITHLGRMERVMTGWLPESADDLPPLDRVDPYHQEMAALGYIVGKKIGLPDGASIVFHLTGPVKRDLAVVVGGRARAVDHVDHPDVELTTDTVTFVQLAAGRIDPQRQIDAGLVTWTGTPELGDRAARNLNFTI
jgi:Mycothiol maleylpyruvate isomerase N-terminal domain/MDMPI C-terminal domain